MSTHEIKVDRPYSRLRIGAYECEIDRSGNPTGKSGQITGWYGMFTPDRLQNEIMPKLAEYASEGRHYPFLIATYQLENKAMVSFRNDVLARKVKASDIKFSRRRREPAFVPTAVVNSASEYRLINS